MNQQTSIFDIPAPESLPYQPHSVTSKQAAEALPNAGTLRAAVYAFIRQCRTDGEIGATDEEMQRCIPMAPSTQRPRRVELVQRGLVRDSGRKRKTLAGRDATVWEATR